MRVTNERITICPYIRPQALVDRLKLEDAECLALNHGLRSRRDMRQGIITGACVRLWTMK